MEQAFLGKLNVMKAVVLHFNLSDPLLAVPRSDD